MVFLLLVTPLVNSLVKGVMSIVVMVSGEVFILLFGYGMVVMDGSIKPERSPSLLSLGYWRSGLFLG